MVWMWDEVEVLFEYCIYMHISLCYHPIPVFLYPILSYYLVAYELTTQHTNFTNERSHITHVATYH